MTETKELLFSLTGMNGTSGNEEEISFKVKPMLEGSYSDRLGNLLASYNPEGKTKVLIEAHIDRIGFIVTEIDEDGFLRLAKCGGVDLRTSIGASVAVFGKETLFGVTCSVPPHLQSGDEKEKKLSIEDLAVDIGMKKEAAEKLVEIGDRVIIHTEQSSLLGKNIVASSLDDRAGAAAVIIAAQNLKEKLKNVNLLVALNTREEVGGQGACASAFSLEPDFAICVDAGFGIDHQTSGVGTIALGKGPSIGISPVLDNALCKKLVELAKKNDIPYQHDVMSSRTGTDADEISVSRCGVKTALISIPVRSMHTQAETANLRDVELTAKLIEAFVLEKEAENA